MILHFIKYQGTGNDFILFDDRQLTFPVDEVLIKRLCDRHFGIGADGILLLRQEAGFDFRMIYYNADGSAATFCGNGGRCITAFAHKSGIRGKNFRFIATDGIHNSLIINDKDLEMNIELEMQDAIIYNCDSESYYLNTGTYHVVKFVSDPDQVDVLAEGRKIRYDNKYQAHGTNVNFACFDGKELYVRTYEKGVENETLSCGTGVTATAIAASLKYGGNDFGVSTSGGKLYVHFNRIGNSFTQVKLTGPVRVVFNGNIEI